METSLNLHRSLRVAVLGRSRGLPHIERKLYHLLMGLLCVSLYGFVLPRWSALVLLVLLGGAFVIADIFRLFLPNVNQLALKIFGKIMRRDELRSITGNSFYILGLIVTVYFFDKPVALLAVLYLALGDPMAAIVGTRWGQHQILGSKTLEGTLANFIVCCFATYFFSKAYPLQPAAGTLGFALMGGAIAVIAELLPTPMDDNFTIPVISAILLTIVV